VNSFVVNFRHFALKKGPQQHGQGKFLEIFKKNRQILRKNVIKSARFFGGFGQIFSFFLLKSPYLATRFWWFANMT
jgi:hypothetical protein